MRDQASRLERNEGLIHTSVNLSRATGMYDSVLDTTQPASNIVNDLISCGVLQDNRNQNNGDQQSQNHNQSILDLHTFAVQPPEGLTEEHDYSTFENASDSIPGSLPEYKAINTPSSFIWGRHGDGRTITVNTSTIDNAYNEITKWRKNTFLVPYGKTGKHFIDKLTQHINDWNNESEMQHIALKAAIVLLAVGLQKPSQKSKVKEHQECLAKRLALWKEGEIDVLVREGWIIQRRLTNSRRADPPNKASVFANLVMTGKINSALRYLGDGDGGVFCP